MKNILQKPYIKKLLFILLGILVIIIIFDRFILPWYVSSPERVVPKVVGMQETEAINSIIEADLEPVIGDTTFDMKFPKGTIIMQKPESGKLVKDGRRVYLFISGGEPAVPVPQLRGKSVRDAKFALERIGLKLGSVDEVPSTQPKGVIFDQQFAEGTPLKKGETVSISVSQGSAPEGEIIVPDLIGKSLSEAERVLADSSLNVGKINYQRSFSLLPNTILDQYPSKGSKLNAGGSVDLFVTKSAESSDENEIIEE